MSKKNGNIKGQVIAERDKLAPEFRPRRQPMDVHNEQLVRKKRVNKRDLENSKKWDGYSDAEILFWERKHAKAYRKHCHLPF